ncbi:MAG TPA: YihY/virulence factor BrkB family protein [Terracidiphilus sp.]|nr:YihY/virulence factor BrkB family protein [Terracidiphilus sp.]
MAIVSNSGTVADPQAESAAAPIVLSGPVPAELSKWYRLRHDGAALINYLLDSEVHTFAFSVAANAILSFIPLVLLLYTLAFSVFHSEAMAGVVSDMIHYFFPSNQAFIVRNMVLAAPHHGVQIISLIMILISCTGIFLPLEVALNQAWGVSKSRNYLLNQAVAFGLAIWMVVLGMISIVLSAGQRQILAFLFFHHTDNFLFNGISNVWLALCSGAASIVFFFSIYWVLPNCKVPAKSVMRASIVTGVVWLISKLIFVAVLPHLDLRELYGPFYISVGLLFWGYVSGLILFAGAQYSVARMGPREK